MGRFKNFNPDKHVLDVIYAFPIFSFTGTGVSNSEVYINGTARLVFVTDTQQVYGGFMANVSLSVPCPMPNKRIIEVDGYVTV